MEHYEVLFIVPGSMKEEEAEGTIGKVKKLLEDLGGKITKDENWGRKSLAYQIKHETQGIYGFLEFDMEKDKLEEVNKRMRLSREILRHLVIKARIKTAEEAMEDEKVQQKIAARKKEAMKQELEEAEQEKKEEAEIKPKKAVAEEKKPVEVKKATPEDEKVSMEDLDKKLDELLNEDIE